MAAARPRDWYRLLLASGFMNPWSPSSPSRNSLSLMALVVGKERFISFKVFKNIYVPGSWGGGSSTSSVPLETHAHTHSIIHAAVRVTVVSSPERQAQLQRGRRWSEMSEPMPPLPSPLSPLQLEIRVLRG